MTPESRRSGVLWDPSAPTSHMQSPEPRPPDAVASSHHHTALLVPAQDPRGALLTEGQRPLRPRVLPGQSRRAVQTLSGVTACRWTCRPSLCEGPLAPRPSNLFLQLQSAPDAPRCPASAGTPPSRSLL